MNRPAEAARPPLVCPVTGEAYASRPEWTLVSDHHTFRLGVLGGEIILCQSFGKTNVEDVVGYCRVVDAILEEFHKPGSRMVLIEDYTHLHSTDNATRQTYIDYHLGHQDQLHAVLFFGLNPFLRLFVRLSRRILPLRLAVDAFPDYRGALQAAFGLLGRDLVEAERSSEGGTTAWRGSALSVKFHPKDERGVVRIELRGRIVRRDVEALGVQLEAFLASQALVSNQYCKMVDFSNMESIDWLAIIPWTRQLNRIDRLFPARRHLVLGMRRWSRYLLVATGLTYLRRVTLLPEVGTEEAIDRITDRVANPPSPERRRFGAWFQSLFERDQRGVAQTLMEFIGEIQWDSEANGANPYPLGHPFHQVAASLLVVKSDFDSLLAERVRREQELERAREKAEESNRLQARFLANVSHEIRTPLNAIMGMGEMLADTGLDLVQQDLLRTMRQSSQGLLAVINDILDLSRMEAGEFRLSQETFDVVGVVEDVGRMLGYLAVSKGLEWNVRKVGVLPSALRGDPVRLRQILVNLAGNAVKFTDRGAVAMEVRRIMAVGGNSVLQFRVEDTGPGIPSDRIGELFQPFRQLDGSLSRRHGGTGLGLAIAHNLVKQMGGVLGVESSPSGSMFSFRLSLPETDPAFLRVESTGAGAEELSGRVLVAEDNKVNQKVVMGMLKKLGIDAEVADNGRLAIEALRAHPAEFQLVLMDIQMPEMDGTEAVRRIRDGEAGECAKLLPVVALTAHAMEGDREIFLERGMNDYLSKPIRIQDLRAVLERWIRDTPPADGSA